jgi:uncharacterized membrane protein
MKELNLFCFVINLTVTVIIGVLLPIIPKLTRKAYLFGVKVPDEAQDLPEVLRMKKRYQIISILGAAVLLAMNIAQFIAAPDMTLIASMYFPLLFVLIYMCAYVPNWKEAVRLKEMKEWKVSNTAYAETVSSHSRGSLSALPWGWYAVTFVLIFIFTTAALTEYPNMPEIIPTHYNINYEPDAWNDKSYGFILLFPIISFISSAFVFLAGVIFEKSKLQIDPKNPALSFAQHRMYRRRMGHCLGFLSLSVSAVFLLNGIPSIWMGLSGPVWTWIPFLPGIIPLTVLCVVSVRAGQGGCKLKPKSNDTGGFNENNQQFVRAGRGDDKYWALGMFYHNPDDPAHIVEDRFGSSLGFNYSRPIVKTVTALVFITVIIGYVWVTTRLLGV